MQKPRRDEREDRKKKNSMTTDITRENAQQKCEGHRVLLHGLLVCVSLLYWLRVWTMALMAEVNQQCRVWEGILSQAKTAATQIRTMGDAC